MKGQMEVDQQNLPGSGQNWKNKLTKPRSPIQHSTPRVSKLSSPSPKKYSKTIKKVNKFDEDLAKLSMIKEINNLEI